MPVVSNIAINTPERPLTEAVLATTLSCHTTRACPLTHKTFTDLRHQTPATGLDQKKTTDPQTIKTSPHPTFTKRRRWPPGPPTTIRPPVPDDPLFAYENPEGRKSPSPPMPPLETAKAQWNAPPGGTGHHLPTRQQYRPARRFDGAATRKNHFTPTGNGKNGSFSVLCRNRRTKHEPPLNRPQTSQTFQRMRVFGSRGGIRRNPSWTNDLPIFL